MKFEIEATSCWSISEFEKEYLSELKRWNFKLTRVTHDENHWKDYYVIEVDTLEDLMKLSQKICNLVIKDSSDEDPTLDGFIEIYDSYRE